MERPDFLYHITKKENLDSILSSGLIPNFGEHSKSKREQKAMVFLCYEKDIDRFLKCFYDVDTVLKVDMRKLKLYTRIIFYETCYDGIITIHEFGSKETISPDRISVYKILDKPYHISNQQNNTP